MAAPLGFVGRQKGLPRPRWSGPVGSSRRFTALLLAPALLLGLLVLAYPLYLVVDLSLHHVGIPNLSDLNAGAVTAQNYRALGSDPTLVGSLLVSLGYTLGGTIPAFLIGLGTAILLNRDFPLRRLFRTLILLPWAVPAVVASILFLWILNTSYGVLNSMLQSVHIINVYIPWLSSQQWALVGVLLPTIWKSYPFFTLLLLAALQGIPRELYEASRVDGARAWATFRAITWPGIRNAAYLASVLQILWTFREFEIIYPMTGGGPANSTQTLAIYLYNQAFQFFNMGYGAALGVITIVICIGFVVIVFPHLQRRTI